MKILLLEDDTLLGESLEEYLEIEGFEVERVTRGEEVFDRTFDNHYDLYILDINVPDVNGLEVLKELYEAEDTTPAIYISALTDIKTITRGFDLGAVDYLKKPFDPEELILRIRHHFRTETDESGRMLEYGELRYEPESGKVIRPDGEVLYLGEIQGRIFGTLLEREGQLVPTQELLELLERSNLNALRVTIAKLKKKLGIDITNVRGQGYLLEKV
jgi:DNA-binding response OmpR family regulator